MITKLRTIKLISRIALGLVWFYEGLVPKILFLRADEIGLVRASHLVWRTPELTLQTLGVAQMLVGLWLIVGIAERAAARPEPRGQIADGKNLRTSRIRRGWLQLCLVTLAGAHPAFAARTFARRTRE